MNAVSRASGDPVRLPGPGGARLVTGHRGQRAGASR
jgi:hypothetical protein